MIKNINIYILKKNFLYHIFISIYDTLYQKNTIIERVKIKKYILFI